MAFLQHVQESITKHTTMDPESQVEEDLLREIPYPIGPRH
jgi:hypothetical protein